MSKFKIPDNICVVGASLICRDHASMHNLQLAIPNKPLDLFLLLWTNCCVVASKERDIAYGVRVHGVLKKFLNSLLKNEFCFVFE